AALKRFDEDGADFLAAEQRAEAGFDHPEGRVTRVPLLTPTRKLRDSCNPSLRDRWKRDEMSELAKLRAKRRAEMFAVRGVERAVAQPVIGARKRDDTAFARGEYRRLERRLDRLEAGIAEDRLAGRTSHTRPTLRSASRDQG